MADRLFDTRDDDTWKVWIALMKGEILPREYEQRVTQIERAKQ